MTAPPKENPPPPAICSRKVRMARATSYRWPPDRPTAGVNCIGLLDSTHRHLATTPSPSEGGDTTLSYRIPFTRRLPSSAPNASFGMAGSDSRRRYCAFVVTQESTLRGYARRQSGGRLPWRFTGSLSRRAGQEYETPMEAGLSPKLTVAKPVMLSFCGLPLSERADEEGSPHTGTRRDGNGTSLGSKLPHPLADSCSLNLVSCDKHCPCNQGVARLRPAQG